MDENTWNETRVDLEEWIADTFEAVRRVESIPGMVVTWANQTFEPTPGTLVYYNKEGIVVAIMSREIMDKIMDFVDDWASNKTEDEKDADIMKMKIMVKILEDMKKEDAR